MPSDNRGSIVTGGLVTGVYESLKASTREPTKNLGAHNVGDCPRKLWYVLNCPELAEQFPPGVRLKLELGDAVEQSLVRWMKDIIHLNQRGDTMRVRIPLPHGGATEIRCRPDAVFQDSAGDIIPVEIKSMSNYAFDRARYHFDIGAVYRAQLEVEMRAIGSKYCHFVGSRKETSALVELRFDRSEEVWTEVCRNVELAIGKNVPERPYTVTDACPGVSDGECVQGLTPKRRQAHKACNGTGKNPLGAVLPRYPCGYCAYKTTCFGPLTEHKSNSDDPFWSLEEKRDESNEVSRELEAPK